MHTLQSRQHHHQLFPSHEGTAAGVSEVSLHVKAERQGLPVVSSLPGPSEPASQKESNKAI